MQCCLGKAREGEGERAAASRGGRRTHPRADVVHRLGAAAPAAQTPHPQHRPAPGLSTSGMFQVLGRVRPSLPRARQQAMSRRAAPDFCRLAPPRRPPCAPHWLLGTGGGAGGAQASAPRRPARPAAGNLGTVRAQRVARGPAAGVCLFFSVCQSADWLRLPSPASIRRGRPTRASGRGRARDF